MKVTSTAIAGCLILEPKVFADDRGFFYESFNQRVFNQATDQDINFVQDNHSKSTKGVVRGLHYQLPPAAQGKLVRAVSGAVLDIAVDIRKSSPSFGKWVAVELSSENHKQFWLPPGLAHGFLVLSDVAEVLYKATDFYSPANERIICWDDPQLGIEWALPEGIQPVVSARDQNGVGFLNADLFD
jgi:dTDP-4-dehydrorhamnose 3,5-epimerase